jgi:predicted phosphodiesterase
MNFLLYFLYRFRMLNNIRKTFQFASDLHLEKGFQNRFIFPVAPVLILAGDIGNPFELSYQKFLTDTSYYFDKVLVLSGNHEYDNTHISKYGDIDLRIKTVCSIKSNLQYLQKDTFTHSDITVAGCTLWSSKPKNKYELHLDHVNWLTNTLKQNTETNFVVVTHHCPLYECLLPKYANKTPNYFASHQERLLRMDNVKLWIHGHSHNNNKLFLYNKWIVSNQYGSYEDPLHGYKNLNK